MRDYSSAPSASSCVRISVLAASPRGAVCAAASGSVFFSSASAAATCVDVIFLLPRICCSSASIIAFTLIALRRSFFARGLAAFFAAAFFLVFAVFFALISLHDKTRRRGRGRVFVKLVLVCLVVAHSSGACPDLAKNDPRWQNLFSAAL